MYAFGAIFSLHFALFRPFIFSTLCSGSLPLFFSVYAKVHLSAQKKTHTPFNKIIEKRERYKESEKARATSPAKRKRKVKACTPNKIPRRVSVYAMESEVSRIKEKKKHISVRESKSKNMYSRLNQLLYIKFMHILWMKEKNSERRKAKRSRSRVKATIKKEERKKIFFFTSL